MNWFRRRQFQRSHSCRAMLLHILLIHSCVILSDAYNLDTLNSLIYRFPGNGDKLSYFGMSVAIRPDSSNIKRSWMLQVGAPRGNVSGLNVKEPGAIYRCYLYGPCKLFVVDGKGNVPGINYGHIYEDRKDEAWTGVSMDIKSANDDAKTVVCSNRWANQNLKNDDNISVTYLMTGACYLQDLCDCSTEHPTFKILPLVNADKIYFPKPYTSNESSYYWGLGQAGTSAALLDDLSAVILGAPGYNNWLGTVIQYNIDARKFDFKVGLFENTKEFKESPYSYIGYQVSYGRFFSDKKLWLLVSAPRSVNYHGKIIIFQFKQSSSVIHMASELIGSTFGEYFGSSLTVSDINNDGFDDLVVGAPLYSRKYPEEGRIYVYLGNNKGNFLFRSQTINGKTGYSRFGSYIAGLEDLDQDGYRDIAVGAPYENDGSGAVYIYKGCKKGLEMEYLQRIAAQDINSGLRGFGISISRGVDIDGNKYNDIAIGAYLSDEVVVIRSRPIIYLHPIIQLEDITLLDRKADSFNLSICSRYSGSNAPQSVRAMRTVEVDINENRAFFMDGKKATDKKNILLTLSEMKCEVLPISINPDNSNYKPILITLKSELPSCNSNGSSPLYVWDSDLKTKDYFDKWCPVGKKKETSIEVPFAGECGADNVCQAEMELSCEILQIQKSAYVVVTSEYITLSLILKNSGEPALNTEIIIYSNLDLISNEYVDGNKQLVSKREFLIDVGTTFVDRFQTEFSFKIATDSLNNNETTDGGNSHLNLKVKAVTKSFEEFFGDNLCDINFNLLSDSTVELYSSPMLTSSFAAKNTSEVNFTLYHELQKKGDTPILVAELSIYIPSYIGLSKEIVFTRVEVETSEWIYSSINDQERKEWGGPSEVDIMWHSQNSTNVSLPLSRTLFLNCSAHAIGCKVVTIVFQDGIPSHVSSHIKLFITLNLNATGSIMGEKDIIHFSSAAVMEYKRLFDIRPTHLYSHASITLYKEEEQKRVQPYVLALSVIAGALLLFLIIFALFKYEFFRRKKKEELQALKSEEIRRQSNYEFPPEIIEELANNSKCQADENQ